MNLTLSRRHLLTTAAAIPLLARPAVLRAETKDLVVGGAAGMAGYMKEFVFPVVEKQLGIHVVFDGTRSLVNLEKLRADKAAPKMSVVLMDDPVMQIAWDDGLIAKLTPSTVPNLAKIKPAAVHLDGAWANYQQPWAGIAYNTKALPNGVLSYATLWDPASKGKVIVPSLQNTEGLWTLLAASHLETGKPFQEAQYDMDAGFKKLASLKPNVLTIYTNQPQAENSAGIGRSLTDGRAVFQLHPHPSGGGVSGWAFRAEGGRVRDALRHLQGEGRPQSSGRGRVHQRLPKPGNPVHSGREILRTADQPERDDPTRVRAAGRPFRPGLGLRQQEPRRLDRALEPGHGLNPRG